jgi:hypothetical protein
MSAISLAAHGLGAAAAALVLAACGGGAGGDAGSAAERPDLPTSDAREGVGMEAQLIGTLEGDADSGCVWITPSEPMAEGDRIPVVWPRGFTAAWDPLRIYRDGGELVAEESDSIVTGGGFTATERERVPEECRSGGEVWLVSSVQKTSSEG